MSAKLSIFVIVFTLANLLACVWLMWWTAKRRDLGGTGLAEQGKKTGHVWDGDLEEYNNPLPRWWLGLFVITIVFALAYFALYPGLGNFAGVLGWTQVNQHADEVRTAQAQLEAHLAGVNKMSIEELSHQPEAMTTAHNLFALNCSTCHGSDARGARGFPNLTDQDWLWGGSADTIYQTISQGRTAVMPAWGDVLGQQGVEDVIAYVMTLSGKQAPADMTSRGKEKFAMLCVACHGPEGKGNQLLGAPNLTDNIWLYGGNIEAVRESVTKGRNGQMPAHADLLGATKTKLLAAYVLSLSQSRPATVALQ